MVTLRATYDCHYFPEGSDDPAEWGGWCNPANPWGTMYGDDEYDPNDTGPAYGRNSPPDEIVLPVYSAAEFVRDFPGGVWDFAEGESEMNFHSGVWRSVTLHLSGAGAETALAIAETL